MLDGGSHETETKFDPFRVDEVAAVQSGLLEYLKHDPMDIAVKIAALRACADLMQQAVTATVITQQIRSILDAR